MKTKIKNNGIYYYFNDMLCVGFDAIISTYAIKYNTLKVQVTRKQVNRVRRACRNTPALIEYATLSPIIKMALIARFGNPTPVDAHDQMIVMQKIMNNQSIAPDGTIGNVEGIADKIKGCAVVAKKFKQ